MVAFRLSAAHVASFDPSASAWIADAGSYTARVANASDTDGVNKTFTIARRVVVAPHKHLLVPAAPLSELKVPAL